MSETGRVCVFGGTFDPIHNAHLQIAREAAVRCRLGQVLFVPAGHPPHKPFDNISAYEDRFHMVKAACADQPSFEASRLEAPPASSYSIETIERLKGQLPPETQIHLLIGSDAFDEIETWKRWQDLLKLVTFIVAARPGSNYQVPDRASVVRIDSLALDVSSTAIRSAIGSGKVPPELPPAVARYIREHRLYGWPTG